MTTTKKKVAKKKAVKKVKAIKHFYALAIEHALPNKNSHVKVVKVDNTLENWSEAKIRKHVNAYLVRQDAVVAKNTILTALRG